MQKFLIALLAAVLFLPVPAHAATEDFSARGEYVMEENDSQDHAYGIALQEAMRQASQQAAVSVKSRSTSSDNQLTNDEVEMVTASLMKIKEKKFDIDVMADGHLLAIATIVATIDIEEAEKMAQQLLAEKAKKQ